MSKRKRSPSPSAVSKSSETLFKRTEPKCGRCRIHKVEIKLKGHKRFCRYRNCNCDDCYDFMRQQRSSADKIAITRACKQNKEKEIPLPQEVPPSPTLLGNRRRCGFQRLLYYTLLEMRNSLIARYIPSELWHIFDLLITCAYELEKGIAIDAIFDRAAYCIRQVIHGDRVPFMMYQRAACCYLSPPTTLKDEGQPVGIRLPDDSLQNLPVWSPYYHLLATNTSPFLESSPPTEPSPGSSVDHSVEPPIEPSIEPSTEPPTDLSTKSSTYYWMERTREYPPCNGKEEVTPPGSPARHQN